MSGKKGMKHFGETIINEVKQLVSEGKSHGEIAEYFGFKDRFVINELLKRERRKEKRIMAGTAPNLKGRPRKNDMTLEQNKDAQIRKLQMEVELLRSFLQVAGRK
jgi:transposase